MKMQFKAIAFAAAALALGQAAWAGEAEAKLVRRIFDDFVTMRSATLIMERN